MSVAFDFIGLVLVGVGAAGVSLGVWSAVQERRPPWLSVKSIPIGRERVWGTAMATIGLGAVALGLDDSLKVAILGFAGVVLVLVGVGVLVLAVRPQSSK